MADLKIRISAVTDGLNRGLSSARSKISSFGNTVKKHFTTIAAVVTGSIIAIDRFATHADDIAKASKRIGLSAQEFQKLQFAAERTGGNMNDVEKAFRRMQKVINDAGRGLKTSQDAFQELGINFKRLQGEAPEKQFAIIAAALNNVNDKSKKAALSQDIFGRSGTKIGLLATEYGELSKQFDQLGGGISDKTIKDAEDYKDAITNLKVALKGLSSEGGMLTFFTNITNQLTAAAVAWGKVAKVMKDLADFDMRKTGQQMRELKDAWLDMPIMPGESSFSKNAKKAKQGAGVASTEDTSPLNTANISALRGGGTLSSLGGDISGGGFAARITIAQEQLNELKQIKDAAMRQVEMYERNVATTVADRWIEEIDKTF